MENAYYPINYSVFHLENKADEFVNGLAAQQATSRRNAFLDINGKVIALVWQKNVGDSVDLVVEKVVADALREHLQKYMRISPTRLEVLPDPVYHVFGEIPEHFDGIPTSPGVITWGEAGSNSVAHHRLLDENEYDRLRILHNWPLQGRDFDKNMFLELNVPEALSYNKGCYLGQEIIARVTSRGQVPKRLLRFRFPDKPQPEILIAETVAGTVSTVAEDNDGDWLAFVMLKKGYDELPEGQLLELPEDADSSA